MVALEVCIAPRRRLEKCHVCGLYSPWKGTRINNFHACA